MTRSIDISINVEPETSYVLTESEGQFEPPLPTNIKAGELIQTQCISPASFKYNGSCADVAWEVSGPDPGVLHFSYAGMNSIQANMLDDGARYRIGMTFAPS